MSWLHRRWASSVSWWHGRATVMPLECSSIAASRAEGTPNGMSEAAEIEAIVDKIVEGTEARGVKLAADIAIATPRSEEHTSELQSLMRISYAVFCLKKKTKQKTTTE